MMGEGLKRVYKIIEEQKKRLRRKNVKRNAI